MKVYAIYTYEGRSETPDGIETKNPQVLYEHIVADSPEKAVVNALKINPKITEHFEWVDVIEIVDTTPRMFNMKQDFKLEGGRYKYEEDVNAK